MDGFALSVVSLCKHLHCKENYFFNFLGSVKPFVEQLQRIFARESKCIRASKREWIYYRFIVDIYLKGFAAYFTTSVYAKCTEGGSESDGSNFLDIFCFLFPLPLADDTLPMG